MDEVSKLLATNFIIEVYYLDWLANIVMVKKANGKWRTCGFHKLEQCLLERQLPIAEN